MRQMRLTRMLARVANDVQRTRVSPGAALGLLKENVSRLQRRPAGRGVARLLQDDGVALSQMGPDTGECAAAHPARGVRLQCIYGLGERRMLRWST